MGRIIYAEESILHDLYNFDKFGGYVPGLILGQSSDHKDFIIHMARTLLQPPKENFDKHNATSKVDSLTKLSELKDSTIADHAKQVTQLLPGGMLVLGVFIVGPGDVFGEPSSQTKLISLLTYIYKYLERSPYLHGNGPSSEKLIFHLNTDTKKYSCRSVNVQPNLSASLRPVEWKFQSDHLKWHQLDCFYDCEQLAPYLITDEKCASPIRKNLQEILHTISKVVCKSVCTIDGEIKDKSDSLEVTDKKKKGKQPGNKSSSKEVKNFEVNLYSPCEDSIDDGNESNVINLCGEMHCNGALSCRVFVHQKATVEEAVKAVKEDIIRSFSSRLEMHWDSLVEEEIGSPDEKIVLHEPPRRVLIPLPHSKVALSDYLFPGEGACESLISLQELLGVKLCENDVLNDFEGQVDPSQLYELTNTSDNTVEDQSLAGSSYSYILIGGIVLSLVVLIVSVVIQFKIK